MTIPGPNLLTVHLMTCPPTNKPHYSNMAIDKCDGIDILLEAARILEKDLSMRIFHVKIKPLKKKKSSAKRVRRV